MTKLSIIVPVYNVENYLRKCINSLLTQDIDKNDYEIIIVNDGSTDGSLDIANELVSKSDNIRVVSQNNKGLSGARNTGINNAKGDYIWFVDSDDFVKQNCLHTLLNTAYEKDLDVLCFNLWIYYTSDNYNKYNIISEGKSEVCSGKEFIQKVKMPPAAWCALYKKSFLERNDLSFYEGILHEDQEFTPRAYYLADRIMFIDEPIYYYLQREGSIMKSKSHKKAISLLTVCDSLYNFVNEKKITDSNTRAYFMGKIVFCFSTSLRYLYKDDPELNIKNYKRKPYYPFKINGSMTRKDVLKILLMNFSLKAYHKIVRFV